MAAWRASDGHSYRERECGSYPTEAEARAACVARGGRLWKEKMQGAFYVLPDNQTLRISARGWASGYVVYEVVRADA